MKKNNSFSKICFNFKQLHYEKWRRSFKKEKSNLDFFRLSYQKTLSLFIATIFIVIASIAQTNTDERLAIQYYSNKEYNKASTYYEKLYNKTNHINFYLKLKDCFIELTAYKKAEKLIKKRSKRFPYQLNYIVDLGNLYAVTQQANKSKSTYESAIKELTPDNQQIIDLANAFLKYKEKDYAIKTYLKGRKLLKGNYSFNVELAQVYNAKGNTQAMLNEYLDLLSYEEAYLPTVQNALQTALEPDDDNSKKQLLKSLLVKKIQKYPDKKVYAEMLIWVYIQEKNFNRAFFQAKALDKRLKETGKRIVTLAQLSYANKDYITAIKCYEYIIEKGSRNYYYTTSKMKLVSVYNQKIIEENNYNQSDLEKLEKFYLSTIEELGKNASTFPLLKGLAHLQAFYLHNTSAAINLLEETLKIPRLSRHNSAQTKIELADIYVFIDEIWEAALLYGQVEKSFKHDQLGEIAKFKNARISFYTGDFAWAKTQLDVLKASTSKLIANDAMQLSLLITDNIGIDTTQAPLMLFAKADLLAFQNKNEEALLLLNTITEKYPYHTIADDILYKRYQINYKQKKYEAAANNLEKIITNYSTDIMADDATYQLAMLYDNQLNNKEAAAKYYKKLLFDHQGSVYVIDARKNYRKIEKGIRILKIDDNVLEFEAD